MPHSNFLRLPFCRTESTSSFNTLPPGSSPYLVRRQRLHIPDPLRILLNTPITTEEPHPAHTLNTLPCPLLRVLERLIDQILRLHIGIEIIADEIIVPLVGDAVA